METSFNDLPEDIIGYIFSFLDPQFLYARVALVSKSWRDIIRDDCYWRTLRVLSIEERLGGTAFIEHIMDQCYNLRYLKIKRHSEQPPTAPPIPLRIPEVCLHRLKTFIFHSVDFKCDDSLRNVLWGSPRLSYLHLQGFITNDMVTLIAGSKSLQSLVLDFSGHDDLLGIKNALIDICQTFVKMRCFSISLCGNLDEDVVRNLFKYRFRNLTRLCLLVVLSDDSVRNISNCTKLTDLRIHCANLTDVSLMRIKKLTGLQKLRFDSGLRFSLEGLKNFFTGNAFPGLKQLTIFVCGRLVDSTLTTIGTYYRNLKCVNLGCCANITNAGILSLVSKCAHLEGLRLRGLELPVKHLFLHHLHNHVPKLRYLVIQGYNTYVPDETVKKFTDLHPLFKTQGCVEIPDLKDTEELYAKYMDNPYAKPLVVYTNENNVPRAMGHSLSS